MQALEVNSSIVDINLEATGMGEEGAKAWRVLGSEAARRIMRVGGSVVSLLLILV